MFGWWLLSRGERAKGTCWYNASTNNCLLLLVSQGEHFMEMDVHEGQRCEKATVKISFLGPPTFQPCTLPASPEAAVVRLCLFVEMHMCKVKGNYWRKKTFRSKHSECWASARRSTFHPEPSQLTPQFHLPIPRCDLALIYIH